MKFQLFSRLALFSVGFPLFSCLNVLLLSLESVAQDYGVDVSFPIHKTKVSENYAWLPHNTDPKNNPAPEELENTPVQNLRDVQPFYDNFLQGCRDFYGKQGAICDQTELERVRMSVRQPQSMQNYTDTGFKKIRAPEKLFKIIKDYWEKNKDLKKSENWPIGNTYTNHWAAPTYLVSVEDTSLPGGGFHLKQRIWDETQKIIQEWTGQELVQTSLYGIRVYTEGSVLSPHVDRMPLISSAIINVDQDVDEDWPLEVYGRDGNAYNVTMEPGDMVLYESHSLIHGRPFPLKGRFYANVFIHFEATGRPIHHDVTDDVKQHGPTLELPPYLVEGTPEVDNWKSQHPGGWQVPGHAEPTVDVTTAHHAAVDGNVRALEEIVKKDKDSLHKRDENGWQPLHEAARGGHKEVVEFLLKHGANVNERTKRGVGGETPLGLAYAFRPDDHDFISFLKSLGGRDVNPEL